MKKILFTLCLLLGAMTLSAQSHQTSDRMAAYREAIGLDMTVPDFETKKIDASVMGPHLAGILEYLLENYTQGTYSRQIALMLGEQIEELKQAFLISRR